MWDARSGELCSTLDDVLPTCCRLVSEYLSRSPIGPSISDTPTPSFTGLSHHLGRTHLLLQRDHARAPGAGKRGEGEEGGLRARGCKHPLVFLLGPRLAPQEDIIIVLLISVIVLPIPYAGHFSSCFPDACFLLNHCITGNSDHDSAASVSRCLVKVWTQAMHLTIYGTATTGAIHEGACCLHIVPIFREGVNNGLMLSRMFDGG